jgi:hypothetical protein
MNEALDLTLLSAGLQAIEREMRLVRVQLDQLAGATPHRLTSIDARLGVLEQSVHGLTAEVARGFGQMHQLLARHEQRFDVLDAGLTSIRAAMAEDTERLMRAITGG